MRDLTKILIYTAVNEGNTARMYGLNKGLQDAKSAIYSSAVPQAIEVLDYSTDRLKTNPEKLENNIILRIDGGDYEIEFIDAKINITKSMDIKSTPLVNRNGAVKERIQEKDYTVNISGNLFAERDKFPYGALRTLNLILSGAGIIEVASSYLCLFDIERLAFKSANFNQGSVNYFNVMPFSLNFDSDEGYEFLVNE